MDMRTGDTFEASKVDMEKLLGGKEPLSVATAAKVGFRELTEVETAQVRACRAMGMRLEALLKEIDTPAVNADKRWVAIARTHFQEGLQAAVRSVTRPAFF